VEKAAPTSPRFVPVDRDRHGARFWRRPADHRHAVGVARPTVVLAELTEAASLFPVAFETTGPVPRAVALLRPDPDAPHPWIDPDARRWRGPYLPAALRAHPFDARPTAGGQLALLVDEASGLLTGRPDAEAFFAPDGRPSAPLREVIGFLAQRHATERETAHAVGLLDAAGVLEPLPALGRLTAAGAAGLLRVVPERLAALDDATLLRLMRGRALALAHAHLVSLQHCTRHVGAAPAAPRAAAARPPHTQAPMLGGFLDAVARARAQEGGIDLSAPGGRRA
jgi:hypothetical protein